MMSPEGIKVKLNEVAHLDICGMAKNQIAAKIVETYSQTAEYQDLLGSIKIDPDELRERVMSKLVDEVIENWKEKKHELD